jgi:CDP-paratose synthetase
VNILITGGTGFLGSTLAKQWIRAGHKLTLMVRQQSSLQRITTLLPDVQLISIEDNQDLVEIIRRVAPETIVHTACTYGRRNETALQLFDTNVRLGVALMDAVVKQNTAYVAFVNTGTSIPPTVSNYALSKCQFTQWGKTIASQHPDCLRFVNVRLQHMYGPGDDISKFTSHVLHACHQNQSHLALTLGEQRRDLIYIDDVVSAYDTLLTNLNELSVCEDIDIGSGQAPTVRHFVETVHNLTKSKTELQFGALSYRMGEAMHCQANTSRISSFGWTPAYSLEQGIQKTIELEFNK